VGSVKSEIPVNTPMVYRKQVKWSNEFKSNRPGRIISGKIKLSQTICQVKRGPVHIGVDYGGGSPGTSPQ